MTHPAWLLGFADEGWWSRRAAPPRHAWADGAQPVRLVDQPVAKDDPDGQAVACSGLLLPGTHEVWLRFLNGRPVRGVITPCLGWWCAAAAARGKTALVLIGDNARWHISQPVRTGITAHNRQVKATGPGGRLVVCQLPTKRPWLHPIAPKWLHPKRKIIEPTRLLAAREVAERVCAALRCPYHDHLPIPKEAA